MDLGRTAMAAHYFKTGKVVGGAAFARRTLVQPFAQKWCARAPLVTPYVNIQIEQMRYRGRTAAYVNPECAQKSPLAEREDFLVMTLVFRDTPDGSRRSAFNVSVWRQHFAGR